MNREEDIKPYIQELKNRKMTFQDINTIIDYVTEMKKSNINENIQYMIDIQDKNGTTPLMFSASNFEAQYVNYLLLNGANPNKKNNDGDTTLILLAKQIPDPFTMYLDEDNTMDSFYDEEDTKQIIQLLLKHGAYIEIKNNQGKTALDILQYKEPSLVEYIQSLKPSIHQVLTEKDKSELKKKRTVEINKSIKFQDPITLEEENINIQNYLQQDKKNLVFMYQGNNYFFTNRDVVQQQLKDALLYPCNQINTQTTFVPEKIVETNIPLYDLKKIGFPYGYPCDMSVLIVNPNHQIFYLVHLKKSFPSFVSRNVLQRKTDWVSGLHCQDGQTSNISKLVKAEPSSDQQIGGKSRKRKMKTTKSKTNKKYGKKKSNNKKSKSNNKKTKSNNKKSKRKRKNYMKHMKMKKRKNIN